MADHTLSENDAKLLLQRLPETVKSEHCHDEAHIRRLLEKCDLVPDRGAAGNYLNKTKSRTSEAFQRG